MPTTMLSGTLLVEAMKLSLRALPIATYAVSLWGLLLEPLAVAFSFFSLTVATGTLGTYLTCGGLQFLLTATTSPSLIRGRVVWKTHTLAHSEVARTISRLQLTWYWPGITAMI